MCTKNRKQQVVYEFFEIQLSKLRTENVKRNLKFLSCLNTQKDYIPFEI